MRLADRFPRLFQALPYLVMVLVITAFYLPELLGPSCAVYNNELDSRYQFYPLWVEQFRQIHLYGWFSLWMNRGGMGFSSLASGLHGSSYLVRGLLMALAPSAQTAADWYVWLHGCIGALGMMLLLQFYGIRRWSSTVTGLFYALGDFVVRTQYLLTFTVLFAMLPWFFLGFEWIWHNRTRSGLMALTITTAALATGMGVLALFFSVQLLVLILVFRLVVTKAPWRYKLTQSTWCLIALGLGLAAAIPVPYYFLLEQSQFIRTPFPSPEKVAGLSTGDLLYFTEPSLLFPPFRYLYLGLLSPLLFIMGGLRAAKFKALGIYTVTFVVILAIAHKTPLFILLFNAVPGWNSIQSTEYITALLTVPLAMFCGLGLQWLIDTIHSDEHPVWPWVLLAGCFLYWYLAGGDKLGALQKPGLVLVILGAALSLSYPLLQSRIPFPSPESRHRLEKGLLALIVAVALSVVFVQKQLLWPAGNADINANPNLKSFVQAVNEQPADHAIWMSFRQRLYYQPNLFYHASGRWFDLYENFQDRAFYDYWWYLTGHTTTPEGWLRSLFHQEAFTAVNANLLNRAGINRLLGTMDYRKDALANGWKSLSQHPPFEVFENPGAYPPAYLSTNWKADPRPVESILADLSRAPAQDFAHHQDIVSTATLPAATGQAPPVSLCMREPKPEVHSVRLDTPLSQTAMLVVLDRYHPFWKAKVDGKPVPVYRVNGLFQGVLVPKGSRTILMMYQPPFLKTLHGLSIAIGVLILALLIFPALFKRIIPDPS